MCERVSCVLCRYCVNMSCHALNHNVDVTSFKCKASRRGHLGAASGPTGPEIGSRRKHVQETEFILCFSASRAESTCLHCYRLSSSTGTYFQQRKQCTTGDWPLRSCLITALVVQPGWQQQFNKSTPMHLLWLAACKVGLHAVTIMGARMAAAYEVAWHHK